MILSLIDYHKWRWKKFGGWDEDVEKSSRVLIAKVSEILSHVGTTKAHVVFGHMPPTFAKKYAGDMDEGDVKLLIYGQAVGIEDKTGIIGMRLVENVERLVEVGLYMKSLIDTHTADVPFIWLQTVSPKDGSRIF
jgi:hypothetical protein